MTRAYNVVDADGHILEPLDLWDKYIDPEVPRAPAAVRHRRERQGTPQRRGQAAGQSAGDRQPRCRRRPAGDRQARHPEVCRRAARAGSTRTRASSTWMPTASTPPSSIRASACSPAPSRIRTSPPRCAAPTTAGSPITASRIPTACSGSRCCRCSRSSWRSTRCATPAKQLGMRGGFLRPNPYHGKKMISDPMYEPFWTMAEELDFSIGFHEGVDQRDADRRRRPLRGGPRGAPHGLAHDGDDAGRR